jgi:hypothetical protein
MRSVVFLEGAVVICWIHEVRAGSGDVEIMRMVRPWTRGRQARLWENIVRGY